MNNIGSKSVIYYNDIPHKDSRYGGLVLNWPNFDSDRECYLLPREESEKVDLAIKEKYDNTFMFYDNVNNY
jgi:hypothetical protein